VLDTGIRRRRGGLVVVSAPGADGVVRVGLVVGRKVGKAVLRNRAKRRLRHAAAVASWPADLDYVVIASAEVVAAPFAQLVRWLEEGAAR
jgi:ribonuclease P protein component